MKYSVIIPVYNNENTLRQTAENVIGSVQPYRESCEIIFVNDGSTDRSLALLLEIKNENENISVISLAGNKGQLTALVAGFEHAAGEFLIVQSADLQEEESMVAQFIQRHLQHPDSDLIIGVRTKNSDYFIFRLLSALFYKLIQYKIPQMPDGGFDTGLMSRTIARKIADASSNHIFFQAEAIRYANRIEHISYHRRRSQGNNLRLKSILFKLRYFLRGILEVYSK